MKSVLTIFSAGFLVRAVAIKKLARMTAVPISFFMMSDDYRYQAIALMEIV